MNFDVFVCNSRKKQPQDPYTVVRSLAPEFSCVRFSKKLFSNRILDFSKISIQKNKNIKQPINGHSMLSKSCKFELIDLGLKISKFYFRN